MRCPLSLISTPLLPAPVTGTVYVARTLTGSTLPDLLIEIPSPINMQIRGANSFLNNIQIQSTFDNLPDLVWSDITMHINGGPKGLLGLRSNGKCGDADTSFASWSGQETQGKSQVNGITNCANQDTVCNNPTVVTSTKGGVKKKGNKKLKTSTTFTTAAGPVTVTSGERAYPLWRFDPKVPAQSTDRGIALYKNPAQILVDQLKEIYIQATLDEVEDPVGGGAAPGLLGQGGTAVERLERLGESAVGIGECKTYKELSRQRAAKRVESGRPQVRDGYAVDLAFEYQTSSPASSRSKASGTPGAAATRRCRLRMRSRSTR